MKDKDKTVADALIEIAEQYGTDIFREQRRVYALLTDLAPGDIFVKERRRIKNAFDSGAVEVLMKAVDDKTCCELYFNESVTRLITQTDMDGQLAKNTMTVLADALSVLPANNSTEHGGVHDNKKIQIDYSGAISDFIYFLQSHIGLIAAIAAALCGAVAVVIGIFTHDMTAKQWLIGLGSAVILADIITVLALIIEDAVYNEKCQTITFALLVVIIADIVLKFVFGNDNFGIIYRIILAAALIGSIVNTVLTRTELEEKYTAPNIIFAALCVFVFFDYPWEVWQWIIGIGGGLLLCLLLAVLALAIESIGPELYQTLSVLLIIVTVANFVLLLLAGTDCLIISCCLLVIFAIGALITAFTSFCEDSGVLGLINIILTILNGGIFLFIVLGSYESLMKFVQPLLEIIRGG